MNLMDHERTWLVEKYTARLSETLVDGPIEGNGGWGGLIYSLRATAERVVEICTFPEEAAK